jgi:hypothetical protein
MESSARLGAADDTITIRSGNIRFRDFMVQVLWLAFTPRNAVGDKPDEE